MKVNKYLFCLILSLFLGQNHNANGQQQYLSFEGILKGDWWVAGGYDKITYTYNKGYYGEGIVGYEKILGAGRWYYYSGTHDFYYNTTAFQQTQNGYFLLALKEEMYYLLIYDADNRPMNMIERVESFDYDNILLIEIVRGGSRNLIRKIN